MTAKAKRPQTFGELYEARLKQWIAEPEGLETVVELLLNDHHSRRIAFEKWAEPGPWPCSICGAEFWIGDVVAEDDLVLCSTCQSR